MTNTQSAANYLNKFGSLLQKKTVLYEITTTIFELNPIAIPLFIWSNAIGIKKYRNDVKSTLFCEYGAYHTLPIYTDMG